jgi:heat shock protein beta
MLLTIIKTKLTLIYLIKLRWYSSKNQTELSSFDEYIARAKTGQDSIFYLAGENKEILMAHPTL